jgi:hypothetical protein
MTPRVRRFIGYLGAGLVATLSVSPGGGVPDARGDGLRSIPQVVLWAWERPEDLRGLADGVGVAFLSQTLALGSGVLDVRPRRHPLRVAHRTPLIAVTRIEIVHDQTLWLDDERFGRIVELVARTADLPQVAAVQVDFDATRSQRRMYATLLRRLGERLDGAVPLSITALASWCAGDRWLEQVPVDEAVAMLFRLGPVNTPYAHIAATRRSAARECSAVGVSLDEPIRLDREGRRVYVFNPQPWTEQAIALAREIAR